MIGLTLFLAFCLVKEYVYANLDIYTRVDNDNDDDESRDTHTLKTISYDELNLKDKWANLCLIFSEKTQQQHITLLK